MVPWQRRMVGGGHVAIRQTKVCGEIPSTWPFVLKRHEGPRAIAPSSTCVFPFCRYVEVPFKAREWRSEPHAGLSGSQQSEGHSRPCHYREEVHISSLASIVDRSSVATIALRAPTLPSKGRTSPPQHVFGRGGCLRARRPGLSPIAFLGHPQGTSMTSVRHGSAP